MRRLGGIGACAFLIWFGRVLLRDKVDYGYFAIGLGVLFLAITIFTWNWEDPPVDVGAYLTKCSVCRGSVSSDAAQCPRCGHPL